MITWTELTEMEPLLLRLERIIANSAPPTRMDGFWWQWTDHKRTLQHLVGWKAINPELRTRTAYDVAYQHLWRLYEDRAEAECGGAS